MSYICLLPDLFSDFWLNSVQKIAPYAHTSRGEIVVGLVNPTCRLFIYTLTKLHDSCKIKTAVETLKEEHKRKEEL